MSREWNEREALILKMLAGYHTATAEATLNTMVEAALAFPVEAVKLACQRFADGEVDGHDTNFKPNLPQLVTQMRLMHGVVAPRDQPKLVSYPIGTLPPPPLVPLGPTSADFGHGRIDMSQMTHAEKEAVLANAGLPPMHKKLPRDVIKPRLQRMQNG